MTKERFDSPYSQYGRLIRIRTLFVKKNVPKTVESGHFMTSSVASVGRSGIKKVSIGSKDCKRNIRATQYNFLCFVRRDANPVTRDAKMQPARRGAIIF